MSRRRTRWRSTIATSEPLVDEEVGPARAGARAARYLFETPVRAVFVHPRREAAVQHMRGRTAYRCVGRVHDYVPAAGGEKVRHIPLEHQTFDQVVYDIEGDRQVGIKQVGAVDKAFAIVKKEALGRIVGETALAQPDRGSGYVQTHVVRIVGQRKLMAVTATELRDRS